LQLHAQRLLLSSLSLTALTSTLSVLVYVSTITTSLFEAGAIAALGAVVSARRLQSRWEKKTSEWQAKLREEGRVVLRDVEGGWRDAVAHGGMGDSEGDVADGERARAREAVETYESLRKLHAMAIQLDLPKILGICVGGTFFLILICTIPIWLCLRRKHKALMASQNSDATRRPRAHLSITDEDVFRMPGMRRFRSMPYGHPAGWAPISSGESVPKRGLAPNAADVDPITGVPPWPVRDLRQVKKIGPKRPVRKPSGALSPITERSTNATATSLSLSTVAASEVEIKDPSQGHTAKGIYQPRGRPDFDASPPGHLKPKPLFHRQPRSVSHGALTNLTHNQRLIGSIRLVSADVPLQDLKSARLPRSSSLCSQQSGQAPNCPVPPLPFKLPIRKRPQVIQSPSDMSLQRVSGMSLLSGNTSVLNETMSKGFSEADTDFTSISLTSPSVPQSTPIGLGISDGINAKWNFSRVDRSASPISISKARDVRPPLSQQHSFRASIHNSLPRNQSSGLSMSLLDRTFPTPEAARKTPTKTLDIPDPISRNPSRRSRLPQASPLTGANVFQIAEDKKAKSASTSVLSTISGNQVSPVKNPYTDRPTSIATDDPFRWDPKTSMQPSKPSAMKTGARKHKRQSCVRISNIPIVIPSKHPAHSVQARDDREPSISPFVSSLPGLFSNQGDGGPSGPAPRPLSTTSNNPCPPSSHTFNPQLPKGIRSPHPHPNPL
ncbi:MAG: hypothetical protein Q9218_008140, partial [Villophora microphyllina]